MPAPLFLLLLGGGAFALYRLINPAPLRRYGANGRVDVNGHVWFLRPGVGYTDVFSPAGAFGLPAELLVVRYATDTKRAIFWAKHEAANVAIADLGLSR